LTKTAEARHPPYLDVPRTSAPLTVGLDPLVNSPRRHYLHQVALSTLREDETAVSSSQKWATYRPPLPLLLQTFQGLTTKNEDFWFRACAYFYSEHHPAGHILFREGDEANKFYLLESGMLRAEYTMPQGRYSEVILAGLPCGELPFFSRTRRTALMKVEQACVVWCLDREKWESLTTREPDIAQELLTISLKLTAERMDSITS
jgi:sulfate permease, SulP family